MRRQGLADTSVEDLGGDVKAGTTLSGALLRGVLETAGNIVGRIGTEVGVETGTEDEVAGVSRAAVLDSSLRHLTTTGAVILHTKGTRLQIKIGPSSYY